MLDDLKHIETTARAEIRKAANLDELEEHRIQFLGRERGALTTVLKRLASLPLKERTRAGKEANRLKQEITLLITARESQLKKTEAESVLKREWLDVTRPGARLQRGHLHPITKVLREAEVIFGSMGFVVAEGPEVETEHYNFDALNIPANHPARDMWDTFWIKNPKFEIPALPAGRRNPKQIQNHKAQSLKLLLRTHTSPVQIRYMETHTPPLRIISPGRVYRYEATDAKHEVQFYQLEGLMVDKNVSIANFKSVIQHFFSRLFGGTVEIRLRPSYFPFTEPSFEVDARLKGKVKGILGDWIEVAGAGMVHPNVFKAVGYNPSEWQGFAFGMGFDRLPMMKYKIPDIRLFHSGDLRFLRQF